MKCKKRIAIYVILLGILVAGSPIGNGLYAQSTGMRRHGPPPEAYSACEGLNVGDTAEFVSPRGDTVTGTCEQYGDQLVLRPDNHRDRSAGNNGASHRSGRSQFGPPPEAFAACEGKNAGDTAEFVSPRGDTVTGTCEQLGDRLVMRPDHSRMHSGN